MSGPHPPEVFTVPKLHEVIAVASGKKGEAEKAVTDAYHLLQKPELFDSLLRTYRPVEENGEQLPAERKLAQKDLNELVSETVAKWTALFDLVLTVDAGNQVAKADVEVDGRVLVKDVPVPTLLFLEKQLANVKAFAEKVPTPDPAERWTVDPALGVLASDPAETSRTRKIQRPVTLYPATPEHPAQTQMIQEDVLAGYWRTQKYTTRMPARDRTAIMDRVGKLLDAVKVARERANAAQVERHAMGDSLLGYVFGPRSS